MASNRIFFVFFAYTICTTQLLAYEPPTVWEVGIGATAISFNDYVGSDERTVVIAPVPFINYHGKVLTIDRESIRSEFFGTDKLRLDLSLSGSIPVDSDDNQARKGMPDLDTVLELGPSLEYEFYRDPINNGSLSVELPLRNAVASDFSNIEDIGWISNPNIKYHRKEYTLDGTWTLQATLGPLLGDKRYHEHFYGVAEKFATTERPSFKADSGFGGWRLSLGFSRRINDIWYGGFIRYIDISDATFADSPLVKQHHSIFGGLAVAWIFSKSANLRN